MKVELHVWRQAGPAAPGEFVRYDVADVSPDMSFLEVLDVLNEQLVARREEPIAFDHDCREGICGACGMVINGRPHGPERATTACQLHMRHFPDGAEIWIEPWRARAFPVVKDLVVDRSAFDRIIQAGGYITVRTGSAPEANSLLVPKRDADLAMDAAQCIGCGACVAACPSRPRFPTSGSCRRANRSVTPGWRTRWRRWMRKGSGRAPITASAWPRAPRRSASTSSRGSIGTT